MSLVTALVAKFVSMYPVMLWSVDYDWWLVKSVCSLSGLSVLVCGTLVFEFSATVLSLAISLVSLTFYLWLSNNNALYFPKQIGSCVWNLMCVGFLIKPVGCWTLQLCCCSCLSWNIRSSRWQCCENNSRCLTHASVYLHKLVRSTQNYSTH